MAIINSFISWLIKKRMHNIELFMNYPHEVQQEWLQKLLLAAQDTVIGKQYDFKSITSAEIFRQRVPIHTYEQLKPYIEQSMRGESNILWNTPTKWYAKSSGTTGSKSKYIPVTQESLEECHYNGGKDMLCIYCHNYPETMIFDGKGIALSGTHRPNEFQQDVLVGDLSAIIVENLPIWAEFHRVPSKQISLMDEWESKLEQTARATIDKNITNLSGVPSWMLLLLKRVLQIADKKDIHEVWPNLEVFFHGGVNFSPYKQQYLDIMPSKTINYFETYNASEGFFGLQDQKDSNELLLMLDYGIYYEFMPMSELGKENPKSLLLHEVDKNVNYALIISTNGGLWRYMIGDTIQFTSLSPYRIMITGRTKSFINVFGEELIEDNASKALEYACQRTHASTAEFTVAPFENEEGIINAHHWVIEFEKEPEDLEYFTELLDNALKTVNSDYEAKRYHNMLLKMPVVTSVKSGSFYTWMKQNHKMGGQHKVPRMSGNRIFIDEILTINLSENL